MDVQDGAADDVEHAASDPLSVSNVISEYQHAAEELLHVDTCDSRDASECADEEVPWRMVQTELSEDSDLIALWHDGTGRYGGHVGRRMPEGEMSRPTGLIDTHRAMFSRFVAGLRMNENAMAGRTTTMMTRRMTRLMPTST